ncbi:hypothetical protein KAU88_03390 [Candidatus Bathyarchaeota archaeon]|nr:hypothetical protein [Candidatus Bathyarchaeota archaeon]
MRGKEADRRKKLLRVLVVLALIIVIVIAAIYNYLNNTYTVALMESLSTFEVTRVEYPSIQPDSIQLNITFILKNPTDFPISIEEIIISLYIDEKYIIGVSLPLNENLPAGEDTFFYSIHDVTGNDVLSSIRSQTYTLRVEGEIVGSISYLFVQARVHKGLAFSKVVEGIP